ncbi:DUF4145 domain-containing protein [Acidovorax sp. M14]|uniref:DUF4145 domain-containing protein n=1 Tax=Acidovorax sp. M14 TaxID=3411354 RepID=UPI003BF5A9FB
MDFRLYQTMGYTEGNRPDYRCPSCGSHLQDGELVSRNTAETRRDKNDPDFEPEWVRETFRHDLTCSHPNCGEPIVLVGEARVLEFNTAGEYGYEPEYAMYYEPRYFIPHLRMFEVPPNTPEKVRKSIDASFNLFFVSSGSALNEIRNAVEFLMDELGVARHETDLLTGEVVRWDLDKRVGKMPNQGGPNLKQHIGAIKTLGNWGSHAVMTNRTDVLEAYKVLHYVLDEMYLRRGEVVKELSKRIKDDDRGK